jgi:hypothetical protein
MMGRIKGMKAGVRERYYAMEGVVIMLSENMCSIVKEWRAVWVWKRWESVAKRL